MSSPPVTFRPSSSTPPNSPCGASPCRPSAPRCCSALGEGAILPIVRADGARPGRLGGDGGAGDRDDRHRLAVQQHPGVDDHHALGRALGHRRGAGVWSGRRHAPCACWTSHLGLFAVRAASWWACRRRSTTLARQSYMTEAVPIEFRARALSTLGGVMRIGMFIGALPRGRGGACVRAVGGLCGRHRGGAGGGGHWASRVPDLEAPPVPCGAGRRPPATSIVSTLRDHRRVFLTLGVGVVLVSRGARVAPGRDPAVGRPPRMLAPSVASLIYGLAGGIDMLVFYPAGKVMDRKGRRCGRGAVDGDHGAWRCC
jgi:hypothetical protein